MEAKQKPLTDAERNSVREAQARIARETAAEQERLSEEMREAFEQNRPRR